MPKNTRSRNADDAEASVTEPTSVVGVKLLSKPQVLERIGRSYPTLWSWMRAGRFPRSRDLHGRPCWMRSTSSCRHCRYAGSKGISPVVMRLVTFALQRVRGTEAPTSNGDGLGQELTDLNLPAGAAKFFRTALILPDNLDEADWKAIGECLHWHEGSIQWWLGDWWHYGAHAYRERASEAAKGILGLDYGTLANYGYVAGRVKPSLRNEHLSWRHHYFVAKLEPPEQKKWLDRALARKWSTRKLQNHLDVSLNNRWDFRLDAERAEQAAAALETRARKACGLAGVAQDLLHCSVEALTSLIEQADNAQRVWGETKEELIAMREEVRQRAHLPQLPPVPEAIPALDEDGNRYTMWRLPGDEVFDNREDAERALALVRQGVHEENERRQQDALFQADEPASQDAQASMLEVT